MLKLTKLKTPKRNFFNKKNVWQCIRDSHFESGGGGANVKDVAKVLGESRINGNGETPSGVSPRRSSSPKTIGFHPGRSNSPRTHVFSSRSSSPNIQIPYVTNSPHGDATEKTSQSSSPLPVPSNFFFFVASADSKKQKILYPGLTLRFSFYFIFSFFFDTGN